MTSLIKYIGEKYIYKAFEISLILKGLSSLFEIVGGVLFLFPFGVMSILSSMIKNELIEDPTDFVATQIQHIIPLISTNGHFYAAFYLLSHGIIKIFLVISLFNKKLWAYPATVIILILFIIYQLYRLSYNYSPFLVFITLLDIVIIILTLHEYKIVKKNTISNN